MNIDWSTYNNFAEAKEFPFSCLIEEFIKGDGRLKPDDYKVKMETVCNIAPSTAENGDFAESAQYIISIPFEDGSPVLYVDDKVTIVTNNETIIGNIERTIPVSLFKKMQFYLKREVWNLRPR